MDNLGRSPRRPKKMKKKKKKKKKKKNEKKKDKTKKARGGDRREKRKETETSGSLPCNLILKNPTKRHTHQSDKKPNIMRVCSPKPSAKHAITKDNLSGSFEENDPTQ